MDSSENAHSNILTNTHRCTHVHAYARTHRHILSRNQLCVRSLLFSPVHPQLIRKLSTSEGTKRKPVTTSESNSAQSSEGSSKSKHLVLHSVNECGIHKILCLFGGHSCFLLFLCIADTAHNLLACVYNKQRQHSNLNIYPSKSIFVCVLCLHVYRRTYLLHISSLSSTWRSICVEQRR